MQVKFQWNQSKDRILSGAIGGDRTRLFYASEARRLMDPYVPSLNQKLNSNVSVYVAPRENLDFTLIKENLQWKSTT